MLSAVERGSTCIRPDLALREREKSAIPWRDREEIPEIRTIRTTHGDTLLPRMTIHMR